MAVAAAITGFGVLLLVGAALEAAVEWLVGLEDIEVTVHRRKRRREW